MSGDRDVRRLAARLRIPSGDLKIEVMRAGGPGGQHQNVTESAVRATHKPTGIQAISRGERSQSHNREIATERLKQALVRLWIDKRSKTRQERRRLRAQAGSGFGCADRVRTYWMVGDAITIDHQTGIETPTRALLEGKRLQPLLEARLRDAAQLRVAGSNP